MSCESVHESWMRTSLGRLLGLEAFAAVIYLSNLEYELVEGDDKIRATNLE